MTGEYAFKCYRAAWLALHPGQPLIEWERVDPKIQECWNSTARALIDRENPELTIRAKDRVIEAITSDNRELNSKIAFLRGSVQSLNDHKATAHAKILRFQSEAEDYKTRVSELSWKIAQMEKELADAKEKAHLSGRPFRKTSRCGSVGSIRFPKLHHASADEIFQSHGTLMDEPAILAIEDEEDRQALETILDCAEPASSIQGAFYGRRNR